ncbi:MAG: copper chaperone PCu(A)C [Burkholderiales bacterium]
MTSLLRSALIAFASCGCGLPAAAAQPVVVSDAWVRAPAPGQKVAAAYMELTSRVNLSLVAVASPAAASVELHNTAVEEGVMKMRPVGRIELPAGKPVKLAPGGLHAMLVDLKQPLKTGDKVLLTLTVQRPDAASRSIFTVQAVVRDGPSEKPHLHRALPQSF